MTTARTTERAALVRAIASQHLADRGPLMPVLHEVMDELGHVAHEDVETIADVLNLSMAEVHGVVSFYHDFRSRSPGRARRRAVSGRGLPVGRGRVPVRRHAGAVGQPRRRRRGHGGLLPRQLRARAVRHPRRPPPRPAVGRATRRADGGVALTVRTSVRSRRRRRDLGRRRRGGRRLRGGRSPGRPQRLARHALARAAGRGRHRRGPGRVPEPHPRRRRCRARGRRDRTSAWSTSTPG